MCLMPALSMKLPETHVQKLHCLVQRQSLFLCQQLLKELSKDDFQHYMQVRAMCIHYIKVAHVYYSTSPGTFASAVNILDVFLWKVKVTERYMSIVSVACFFIAAKMMEADEGTPDARQLASFHEWSPKDLCRMELRILAKLNWCVTTVTYLDFLPLFANVYGLNQNLVCSDSVIAVAEKCLSLHSTVLMEPSVLALSLLHHVVGEVSGDAMDLQLMVYCNVQESNLKECKNRLSLLSSTINSSPPSSPTRLKFPMKIFDRPSEMGVTCLPTIVEEPSA